VEAFPSAAHIGGWKINESRRKKETCIQIMDIDYALVGHFAG